MNLLIFFFILLTGNIYSTSVLFHKEFGLRSQLNTKAKTLTLFDDHEKILVQQNVAYSSLLGIKTTPCGTRLFYGGGFKFSGKINLPNTKIHNSLIIIGSEWQMYTGLKMPSKNLQSLQLLCRKVEWKKPTECNSICDMLMTFGDSQGISNSVIYYNTETKNQHQVTISGLKSFEQVHWFYYLANGYLFKFHNQKKIQYLKSKSINATAGPRDLTYSSDQVTYISVASESAYLDFTYINDRILLHGTYQTSICEFLCWFDPLNGQLEKLNGLDPSISADGFRALGQEGNYTSIDFDYDNGNIVILEKQKVHIYKSQINQTVSLSDVVPYDRKYILNCGYYENCKYGDVYASKDLFVHSHSKLNNMVINYPNSVQTYPKGTNFTVYLNNHLRLTNEFISNSSCIWNINGRIYKERIRVTSNNLECLSPEEITTRTVVTVSVKSLLLNRHGFSRETKYIPMQVNFQFFQGTPIIPLKDGKYDNEILEYNLATVYILVVVGVVLLTLITVLLSILSCFVSKNVKFFETFLMLLDKRNLLEINGKDVVIKEKSRVAGMMTILFTFLLYIVICIKIYQYHTNIQTGIINHKSPFYGLSFKPTFEIATNSDYFEWFNIVLLPLKIFGAGTPNNRTKKIVTFQYESYTTNEPIHYIYPVIMHYDKKLKILKRILYSDKIPDFHYRAIRNNYNSWFEFDEDPFNNDISHIILYANWLVINSAKSTIFDYPLRFYSNLLIGSTEKKYLNREKYLIVTSVGIGERKRDQNFTKFTYEISKEHHEITISSQDPITTFLEIITTFLGLSFIYEIISNILITIFDIIPMFGTLLVISIIYLILVISEISGALAVSTTLATIFNNVYISLGFTYLFVQPPYILIVFSYINIVNIIFSYIWRNNESFVKHKSKFYILIILRNTTGLLHFIFFGVIAISLDIFFILLMIYYAHVDNSDHDNHVVEKCHELRDSLLKIISRNKNETNKENV